MKYESEILKVMHQDAKEMYKIGAITEARMREYDELCLANPKTKNKSSPAYADNSANMDELWAEKAAADFNKNKQEKLYSLEEVKQKLEKTKRLTKTR
jgi:hypothetical protein